jgi:hypothetical protein
MSKEQTTESLMTALANVWKKEVALHAARIAELETQLMHAKCSQQHFRFALEYVANMECNCHGYTGPCGCGKRMIEEASEALKETYS